MSKNLQNPSTIIPARLEVYGQDVETASDDSLLSMLTRLEGHKTELGELTTKSKSVARTIGQIGESIKAVVAELDGRLEQEENS